jgi:hypothetical protein
VFAGILAVAAGAPLAVNASVMAAAAMDIAASQRNLKKLLNLILSSSFMSCLRI